MSNRYPSRAARIEPRGSPARPKYSPANDNRPRPPMPKPANDNFPKHGFARPSAIPRRLLGRMLARAIPGIGLVLTAYDLYDAWKRLNAEPGLPGRAMDITGYTRRDDLECAVNGPWLAYTRICGVTGLCGGGALASTTIPAALTQPFTQAQIYEWWNFTNLTHPARVNSRRHRWDRDAPTSQGYILPPRPSFIPFRFPDEVPFVPYLNPPNVEPRPNQPIVPVRPPVRRPWEGPDLRPDGSTRGETRRIPGIDPRSLPRPRPSPRRTKERKVRTDHSTARRIMGRLLSNYSELGDFLDVLYDALPDDIKLPGEPNSKERYMHLFENLDSVDIGEAMQGWIENEQEDRLWAKGFKQLTDTFEKYGIELPTLRM